MLCMVSPSGVGLVFAFRFMLSEVSAFCTGGGPLRSGALRIVVFGQERRETAAHVPFHAARESAKEHLCADPLGAGDVDRTDVESGGGALCRRSRE